METTGKALVEHWDWAATKGLMKTATAHSLKSACSQVLGVEDNWEAIDVRSLDVESLLLRFQNKRGKDYLPKSLEVYKRRFRQAVSLFLEYVDDPSAWKPTSRTSTVSQATGNSAGRPQGNTQKEATTTRQIKSVTQSDLVEYPYPLRPDLVVYLKLPVDLKSIEVKRLSAFMKTITVDFGSDNLFSDALE